jgi:hypothetical protein
MSIPENGPKATKSESTRLVNTEKPQGGSFGPGIISSGAALYALEARRGGRSLHLTRNIFTVLL